MKDNGLVKTVKFKEGKYVGDPINAVRIFNEKEVDELMLLDIDKSKNKMQPNFDLIQKIADESRMPICYGGGITSVSQAKKIIEMGVEKVAISNAFVNNPQLVNEISEVIGAQSVVIVLDVRKKTFSSDYNIFTLNGTIKSPKSLKSTLNQINKLNYGELVVNSIDNDGIMCGYDFKLAKLCREKTEKPLTILGGASNLKDIQSLIKEFKIIGAAAGSLFVFKGKYKAVLLNYPDKTERKRLYL